MKELELKTEVKELDLKVEELEERIAPECFIVMTTPGGEEVHIPFNPNGPVGPFAISDRAAVAIPLRAFCTLD